MRRPDRAALRTPNAGKLWMLPQHPDAHGLMPYEMAEIEECSNSLEQALLNNPYEKLVKSAESPSIYCSTSY